MSDEFDRALGERLRRLEAAVPLASAAGILPIAPPSPRSQARIGGSVFVLLLVGLAIVALAVGLVPGGSLPSSVSTNPLASPTTPLASPPSGIVTNTAGGWTFERPASWISWQPNAFITLATGPLVYLANFPLLPECATSWAAPSHPPDSSGNACSLPFTALPAGGVFVQFYSGRLPRPLPSAGEPIEFDGGQTRLVTHRPGQCLQVTVDEYLSVAIPDREAPAMTDLSVVACMNGPDLDQADQAFRAFLASIRSVPEQGAAYPDACATFQLSQRRCDYIVNWARRDAGLGEADPAAIELLGDPACPGSRDARPCGIMRTMAFVVRVRVIPADGEPSDHPVFCGILSAYTLLCTDRPKIRVITPTTNGYWDVPCSGEAPDAPCAPPIPTIDPAAASGARAFSVSDLHIPIDHVGPYSIALGEAILPNGVLTDATLTLADDSPANLLLEGGRVELVLSSLDGGLPFENAYTHGWRPGTERVAVTLEFSVEWFEPGAELVVAEATVK